MNACSFLCFRGFAPLTSCFSAVLVLEWLQVARKTADGRSVVDMGACSEADPSNKLTAGAALHGMVINLNCWCINSENVLKKEWAPELFIVGIFQGGAWKVHVHTKRRTPMFSS